MVERRGVEPLEPQLGSSPILLEVGGESSDELPSLCAVLRSARMTAGHELTDIAAALRIRLLYLEALEEGRFNDLPGAAYAAGFLRSYSKFLGLDSEEMVERLKRETSSGTIRHDLTFPMPPKEGRNPKPWLVLVVLLLAGLAYGGWHVYSNEGLIATNLVSDVSNKLTEAAGLSNDEAVMAAVATESVATEDDAGEAQSTVSSRQPAASADTMESALPQSGRAVPMIRNANAQSMESTNSEGFDVASVSSEGANLPVHRPTIYGVENADFRISIMATADSWVQIQGPNNELLLTRILRTGEIYQVPNRSGLIMVTGNAGALELRVDGTVVNSLGPIGVVRRNVSLDPATLVAGSEADH